MVVGRHLEYFSHIINYIPKNSTVYINYLAQNKLTFFLFQFLSWSLCVIVFFSLKCMYNVKFIDFVDRETSLIIFFCFQIQIF